MAIKIRRIEVDDGNQTVSVALEKENKQAYIKAQKSYQKAKDKLDKLNEEEDNQEISLKKKKNDAKQYLDYKKRKLAKLNEELKLSHLIEQAKKNPYEQEFKLRYPKVKEPGDAYEYKRAKQRKLKRIVFTTLALLTVGTLLFGPLIVPPLILAVQAFRFYKHYKSLNRFKNLEMKKIGYEEKKSKNEFKHKYKRAKQWKLFRIGITIAVMSAIVITSVVLTGGIPIIPTIIGAVGAVRLIKHARSLYRFKNLETKKMACEEKESKNEFKNVSELAISPTNSLQKINQLRRQKTKAPRMNVRKM